MRYTVFLPIEVALEYRPPPIRSRIKAESFILKAIENRISSNISREIAMEKTYRPQPVFEEIRHSQVFTSSRADRKVAFLLSSPLIVTAIVFYKDINGTPLQNSNSEQYRIFCSFNVYTEAKPCFANTSAEGCELLKKTK